jgi:hypothetical protein
MSVREIGTALDAALELTAKGESVFPCARDKRLKSPGGFKDDATCDLAQVAVAIREASVSCTICGLAAEATRPLYLFRRDLEHIGRAAGLAHVDCVRRARDELERRRREAAS